MEEVDRIIFHTLNELGCNFEEALSLKQWETDHIVKAVSTCLLIIHPELKVSKSLPPNMGARYRACQELAQACQNLGYPGELGYQTFLYSGESDMRRLLMFLIEKLPKEESNFVEKLTSSQEFLRDLKSNVGQELGRCWLPYEVQNTATSHFGNIASLLNLDDMEWKYVVPTVISLHSKGTLVGRYIESTPSTLKPPVPAKRKPQIAPKPMPRKTELVHEGPCEKLNKTENFEKTIELLTEDLEELKCKKERTSANLLSDMHLLEKERGKNLLQSRIFEILPQGEQGVITLEKLIEARSQKLISLAIQWEKHRVPLIEQYRSKMQLYTNKQSESAKRVETLRDLSVRRKEYEADLKSKQQLLEQLKLEQSKLKNDVKRSVYTRRILEIIGNIEKQKLEIDKVLKDTRDLQYEIDLLSGQVARSFAVADETIFTDAKRDDTSRKIYKLLAALHTDCTEIIQMVDETGANLREIRDLEEQIENQQNKDVSGKLERITADLKQMQRESTQLSLQIKRLQSIQTS